MINIFVIGVFISGILLGLAISAVVFGILAFFRAGIEYKVKVIEKKLGNAGPQPRGGIFMPEDEADIARKEHIEKNKAMGKDTPIDELR